MEDKCNNELRKKNDLLFNTDHYFFICSKSRIQQEFYKSIK